MGSAGYRAMSWRLSRNPARTVFRIGLEHAQLRRDHPVLNDIPTGDTGLHAYFVHSFHMKPKDVGSIIADTEYGEPVTAIVGRDNIIGSQFHPEKSQKLGLAFIANFLRWRP